MNNKNAMDNREFLERTNYRVIKIKRRHILRADSPVNKLIKKAFTNGEFFNRREEHTLPIHFCRLLQIITPSRAHDTRPPVESPAPLSAFLRTTTRIYFPRHGKKKKRKTPPPLLFVFPLLLSIGIIPVQILWTKVYI